MFDELLLLQKRRTKTKLTYAIPNHINGYMADGCIG